MLALHGAALICAGCGGGSSAGVSPTPVPPGLGDGNCTARGLEGAAVRVTTPDHFTLALPDGWEDISASHAPRFLVWLRPQGSATDALRIADVSRSGASSADDAAARARDADHTAGATVGDIHHCVVAGEMAAFYTADYPAQPHATLLLLVHRSHIYQVEVDDSAGDHDAVVATVKLILDSWTWNS